MEVNRPVSIILARAANGVIGKNQALPWRIPEDLANFKKVTWGQPVIMGRKTWDSLPVKFRPLPGRLNIVVSRNTQLVLEGGALIAGSLDQALKLCPKDSEPWVIGGAELYAEAMPVARKAVVTEIHREFEGDKFAPTLDNTWFEIVREDHVSTSGIPFSFVTYERRT